jgi:hypothetical protein
MRPFCALWQFDTIFSRFICNLCNELLMADIASHHQGLIKRERDARTCFAGGTGGREENVFGVSAKRRIDQCQSIDEPNSC